MWWARPQQIYVGAGRVLVPAAGGGARRESVEQYRCDAGQEEVLVERLLRERPARRTRLFLANGLIRFQSVPRIAGIWRQIERTRAAMRLARLDPAQWEGCVEDPSLESAWLLSALHRERRTKLASLRDRMGGRIEMIAAYSAVVASGIRVRGDTPSLVAILEGEDLAWVVRTASSLRAAGQVRGIDAGDIGDEVERLAMANGVPAGRRYVFALEADGEAETQQHAEMRGLPLRSIVRVVEGASP